MKQAVALLINDIHVSRDNIPEFRKNWDEMMSVCERYNVCDVIIGGDLWQSRSAQTLPVLLAVRQALISADKKKLNVSIVAGNHDLVDQESVESYNHIFSEYPGVEVIDDYAAFDYDTEVLLHVMRYYPENGSFIEHYNEVCKCIDKSKVNLLYIHEGINGGLAHSSDHELPTKIFEPFDKVLVGHYHDRKKIPNTNIEYIGASRQHTFGEDEEKGYTVVFEDGSYEFVKNEVNTRYCTVEVNAAEADKASVKDDSRYKCRIKVVCDEKQAKLFDRQKFLDMGFNKVEMVASQPIDVQEAASGIDEKYDLQGIRKEYQGYCDENDIDSKLGMKYLEG